MAEVSKPFGRSELWVPLAALDLRKIQKLASRERVDVGRYATALRRAGKLKAVA
jgi:hypothetical protein